MVARQVGEAREGRSKRRTRALKCRQTDHIHYSPSLASGYASLAPSTNYRTTLGELTPPQPRPIHGATLELRRKADDCERGFRLGCFIFDEASKPRMRGPKGGTSANIGQDCQSVRFTTCCKPLSGQW